jgi:membrane-bound ClpP family serine protease
MIGGCVAAFSQYGSNGGWIATAAAVALVTLALFVEFRILPKTRIGKRAFLTSEITAKSSNFSEQAAELVGKSAEAATLLSPTGYVRIDGKAYEAFSPAGQIPVGTALHVVGADNFRLIVSPTPSKTA